MRLTVKAMAEMLSLPALAQMRILSDQKYPKNEPQSFRTPYYAPVLNVIRAYYKSGNKPSALDAGVTKVQGVALESKRLNNLRALDSFKASAMAKRKFVVQKNLKLEHQVGALELRLFPDLHADESGSERVFFFNCRAVKLETEAALRTIEIAHWVAEQCGIKMPIASIEYVDLFTGKSHTTAKRRASTIKNVTLNVQPLSVLWNSL